MYSNYNDKYLNNYRSGNENLSQGYYQMPNYNYYRENESPYLGYNQFNQYGNINTVQMRNNILKSQYPAIYNDINKIVDDIAPRYRNITTTEDIVENMTDEILTIYTSNSENSKNENENETRNTKSVQEKSTRQVENIAELSRRNNILRDLIKIILITRLIKFNLDGIHGGNRTSNYQRYNMPYDYTAREQYAIANDTSNLYMGYQPRNYF